MFFLGMVVRAIEGDSYVAHCSKDNITIITTNIASKIAV